LGGGISGQSSSTFFGEINIFAKTSCIRNIKVLSMFCGNSITTVYTIFNIDNIWNNTTSTITSIKFCNSSVYFQPGTHVIIWRAS
jgi:hypothetical protein